MILAVDVDYRADFAIAAGVTFNKWDDETPSRVFHSKITNVEDYKPGEFYRREMPCILQLLTDHKLTPDLIVIDGFVVLGLDSRPGLGMHLYDTLDAKIAVIGVAKTVFKGSNAESEVFRGKSQKPLYVTAAGIACKTAKDHVRSMHGKHRMPTLLKLVDRECRKS